MNCNKYINHFILVPLVAGLFGNLSLGIIIAGLTGLIWGLERGVLLISLTTTLLVILTGNINMEIIFIFVITLVYLKKEYKILDYTDSNLSYFILFFISIMLYPLLRQVLGIVPVRMLNDFNIAGEVLIIAGLILFLLRINIVLQAGVQSKTLLKHILFFFCSVLGLIGNYLLIPIWIAGIYLIESYQHKVSSTVDFDKKGYLLFNSFIIVIVTFAAFLLLPIGFISGLVLFLVFVFLFRNIKELPLVEMVYLSMILGIVAGRMGLLV